jgi:hypothetical protein
MPDSLWDFFACWGIASAISCAILLLVGARLYYKNQLSEDTYL